MAAGLGADGWNGERLFQAARFITEMEYQHLVFEEFARKVQPAINPFEPFAFTQTELNPAVKAEFAHAVYRFGHSMLTETISAGTRMAPESTGFSVTPTTPGQPERHLAARRVPQPAGVHRRRPRWCADLGRGGRQRHHGYVGPGRQ
jgi:hypothetical protein